MDNQKTELNIILENQNKKFENITNINNTLLLTTGEDSQLDDVKRSLGWDDTDRVIRSKYNKVLELNQIKEKNIDFTILNIESIYDYCIDNNYVIVNIKDYKGKITKELLQAISDFSKKQDLRLNSDSNLKNLYVMCRFCDVNGESNNNVNKSKRYSQKELPKIMLLEKVDKGIRYTEDFYKVIFEMGSKTPITNFINSIFKTHGKTRNILNYFMLYGGLFFLYLLISTLLTTIGDVTKNNISFIHSNLTNELLIATSIILIINYLIPTAHRNHEDSIVSYKHSNYKEYFQDGRYKYITDYLFHHNEIVILNLKKIKFKVMLSFIMMFTSFVLLSSFINRLTKIIVLSKLPNQTSILVEQFTEKDKLHFYKVSTLKRTSLLNYNKTTKIEDHTPKPVIKKILTKKPKK